MASLTRWTWVWVNSGSWWWTGRSGVLRFMGSQRVGHDWATGPNWTEPGFTEWLWELKTLRVRAQHGPWGPVGAQYMLAATALITQINLGLPAHRIQKKLKSDSKSLGDNLHIPTQCFLALRQQREACRHSTAKFLKFHLYSPFSPKFLKSFFSLSSPSSSSPYHFFGTPLLPWGPSPSFLGAFFLQVKPWAFLTQGDSCVFSFLWSGLPAVGSVSRARPRSQALRKFSSLGRRKRAKNPDALMFFSAHETLASCHVWQTSFITGIGY